MRAKVVIPLMLVALFVVFLPFVIRPKHPATGGPAEAVMLAAEPSATDSVRQWGSGSSAASPEESQPVLHITTDAGADQPPTAQYEDYVNRRIAELGDLGMTGDASSLITIESELDSRDPRIQAAAVSAAIQFGSRDAIPALRDACGHTDDPAQKLNLRKAIEFLELPSESEMVHPTVLAAGGSAAN